jgi:hypothetical protein
LRNDVHTYCRKQSFGWALTDLSTIRDRMIQAVRFSIESDAVLAALALGEPTASART